jgi:hypothetical protein
VGDYLVGGGAKRSEAGLILSLVLGVVGGGFGGRFF